MQTPQFWPPDLVIFDCDGVLVDSERITNRVMQASFARHGLVLELDEIMGLFVGGTIQGVMDLAREMGADLPHDWVAQINAQMHSVLAREVEVVSGVPSLLDMLDAAGIAYAVGSNGPHSKMDVTLGRTGLKARFAGRIVSREDVANPKPAPDVYLMAARKAGVDPSRCAVIEDSASGAKAGKAAGMITFGYVADSPRAKLEPICDAVFDDMRDLPELLGIT